MAGRPTLADETRRGRMPSVVGLETEALVAEETGGLISGPDPDLDPAERRLLARMPLHAITSVHGEAGLGCGWVIVVVSSQLGFPSPVRQLECSCPAKASVRPQEI